MTDNTQYTDINRGNNDVTPEGVLAEQSEVLLDDSQRATGWHEDANQEWEEREARNELKHVAGLGELQDVTEVEYRKVRLERVVLVGVWSSAVTTQAKAEESLRELAALAETAGAVVCDGLLQHRSKPDAATYVGSGKAKEIAGIVARELADRCVYRGRRPAAVTAPCIGGRRQSQGGGSHRGDSGHLRPARHLA